MKTLRLASYNLESLFDRAKALNQKTWDAGRPVLDTWSKLNKLLGKKIYTAADKKAILDGLKDLGLRNKDDGGTFARLRQNRGHLLKRSKGKVEVIANGRGDWIGWVELKTEAVNEGATQNTARVVKDLGADVLGTVEVDNRIALLRFNEQLLPTVKARPYKHVMLIDGNDDRGIDVGIMTKDGYEIESISSHVDDADKSGRIFSRDCAQYDIRIPSGELVTLLVNHFKSKGYGTPKESNAKRRKQAERVRKIYWDLRDSGHKYIAIIGDFNDTPDSWPLAPLLGKSSDLTDVSEHPKFHNDGRPGTFGNGNKSEKFDYILLSPALFKKVKDAGVFRRGVWGGENGTLFPHYPSIEKREDAASDHAAIWVDLNL